MIGDALPASWSAPAGVAVAGLFVGGALACEIVARSVRMPRTESGVWRAVAVVLGLMALNSALGADRQIALWLRDIAHDLGWYEFRRPLQAAAIGAFIGGLCVAVARGWRRTNVAALPLPTRAAFAAAPVLLTVAALRAVSHHQTDRWLDSRVAGHGAGRWIECLCLVVVVWAAGRRWSVVRSPDPRGVRRV